MKKLLPLLVVVLMALCYQNSTAQETIVVPTYNPYSQGFETSTDGWLTTIGTSNYGTIARVSSGTDGIVSKAGSWHAKVGHNASGPFSRFDKYRSTWADGGWKASLDVYLDPNWASGSGFDLSVASSNQANAHLRDFIFHVSKDISQNQLFVAGSNNSDYASKQDLENHNPYTVTTAGWYTFEYLFRNQNGQLAVDLNLKDANGALLWTTTRTNANDLISTIVGGNRYTWFTFINIPGDLHIDNHKLEIYHNTITSAVKSAVAGDEIQVAAGTYPEQVVVTNLAGIKLIGAIDGDGKPTSKITPGAISNGNGIKVTSSPNALIKNFEITGATGTSGDDRGWGILADLSDGVVIDNIFSHQNAADGIRVRGSVNATVQNCVSLNNSDGITFYALGSLLNNEVGNSTMRGIYVYAQSAGSGRTGSVTITGNKVYNNSNGGAISSTDQKVGGIIVYSAAHVPAITYAIIENNEIYSNVGPGLLVYKVNNEHQNGKANQPGIPVQTTTISTVKNNTIYNNTNRGTIGHGDGILIYMSHYVNVENNTLYNNAAAGLRVTNNYKYAEFGPTTNITMTENNIYDNNIGVVVQGGTNYQVTGATLNHNTIKNNTTNLSYLNNAAVELDATSNYWGTVDATEVAAKISGTPNYTPWCNEDFTWCGYPALPPAPFFVDLNFTSSTEGWGVTHFDNIQDAVNAAIAGTTINVAAGMYLLTSQLNLDKNGISILGNGNVTIKANNAGWSTVNGHKHLIGIYAGTEANPVTISNITMDFNSQCFGLNTYNNAYGILNDVTLNGSKGAALTVNGSTIIATNLNTSANAWGAVNVDPGSGVSTPSVFTLNSGSLTENSQIWSDGRNANASATVTVNATGYNQYKVGTTKIWTNRPLANCATITRTGETTIYSTIQAAIDAAIADDIINVYPGTYAENLNLNQAGVKIISSVAHAATIEGLISITAPNCELNGFKMRNYQVTQGGAPVINVDAANTTINNFDMYQENFVSTQPHEITLTANASGSNVLNSIVDRGYNGGHPSILVKEGANNVLIQNNQVAENGKSSIAAAIGAGCTITIKDNVVHNGYDEGIWFWPVRADGHLILEGNTVGTTGAGKSQIKVVDKPATLNGVTGTTSMKSKAYTDNPNITSIYFQWEKPVVNVTKDLFYDQIQAAVNAADAGDVIEVAAGTYTEDVTVSKALTIKGANAGIAAGSNPGNRTAETIVIGGFRMTAAATIDGFNIQNGTTSGSLKVGVAVTVSDVTVKNCIIENVLTPAQSDGISTQHNTHNLTLLNNTIRNNWRGIYLNPGMGHTFTGNLIDANNGVGVGIGSDGQSNLTLTNNTISNHTLEGWGASAVGENVVASNNMLLNNGKSIAHYGGNAINASCNYWGSMNQDEIATFVQGNVTYSPFSNEAMNCGFPLEIVWVAPNGNNETGDGTYYKPFKTITKGISSVREGGTVIAQPGEYFERVTINKKDITVKSQSGRNNTFIKTTVTGSETAGITILKDMGVVTIDGFTVENFRGGIVQGMTNSEGTASIIRNCKIIPENFSATTGYLRNGIQVSGDGSQVIGNYVFGAPLTSNWSSTAIHVVNAKDVLVKNNTVNTGSVNIGIGVTNWSAASVENILIENNTVHTAGHAVRLSGQTEDRNINNVTVRNNEFTDNKVGVSFTKSTINNVRIEGNNLSNEDNYGMYVYSTATINNIVVYKNILAALGNATSTLINAEFNYWGHASGPKVAISETETDGGAGSLVSGKVDVSPFYTNETMTATSHIKVGGADQFDNLQNADILAQKGDVVEITTGEEFYPAATISKGYSILANYNGIGTLTSTSDDDVIIKEAFFTGGISGDASTSANDYAVVSGKGNVYAADCSFDGATTRAAVLLRVSQNPPTTGMFIFNNPRIDLGEPAFHLDPLSTNAIANGEKVSEWYNLGTTEIPAMMNIDRRKPTLALNSILGNPAVLFNSIDGTALEVKDTPEQVFTDRAAFNSPGKESRTIFVVFKPTNVSNSQVIFEVGGQRSGYNIAIQNGYALMGMWNDRQRSFFMSNEALVAGTTYIAAFEYIYEAAGQETPELSYIRATLNGSLSGSLNFGGLINDNRKDMGIGAAVNGTSMRNFNYGNNYTLHFDGLIAEVLVYDESKNVTAITEILTEKYIGSLLPQELGKINWTAWQEEDQIDENNGLTVYPNPVSVSSLVNLNLDSQTNVTIELSNAFGEKVMTVFSGIANAGHSNYTIDASNLPSGVYNLVVNGNGILKSTKVVVVK